MDNIERTEVPSREEFYERYVLAQKPVVITGLFTGQAVDEIRTIDQVRSRFGSVQTAVYENHEDSFVRFVESFLAGSPNFERRHETSTIAGYLDLVAADPTVTSMCSEMPAQPWPDLRGMYEAPDLVFDESGKPDDLLEEVWIGNAGNFTHLHYDADHRNNLLHHLCGRKRVVLVEPRYAQRLAPMQNNSFISPGRMSQDAHDEFVDFVHGYQTVLGPGDTLFIPAMMWHYFEYLETAMAIGFRFHKHPDAAYLTSERMLPHFTVQRLAWALASSAATPEVRTAFAEVKAACEVVYADPIQRGRALGELLSRIHADILAEPGEGSFARPFANSICQVIDDLACLVYQPGPEEVPTGPKRMAEANAV